MSFEKPTAAQLENRFKHHPPHGTQASRYSQIRSAILDTAKTCVALTPCSPEQARALNALDEAMMLFNAAIARNEASPANDFEVLRTVLETVAAQHPRFKTVPRDTDAPTEPTRE